MKSVQPTLFGESDSPDRAFLLTNRYNLLEVLASRLVEPVEGFSKYYRDLLELCPGRIPLIASPFPADAMELVSSEDATAFPVALEIQNQVLGTGTPEADLPGGPTGIRMHCWAPEGTIPLTHVSAIHFRNAAELDEHRLRDYENVRHAGDRYRISPELFERSNTASKGLLDWLRSTDPDPRVLATGMEPDRSSGAIALMAHLLPAEDAAIETLRRCLDPPRSRRGKPHADWLVAGLTGRPSRQPILDEILFTVSFEIFASSDASQSWRGADVLTTIWEAIGPQLGSAGSERMNTHFNRIHQILRNELPFERLKPHGSPAEKALLLAMMRPDPYRLADWGAQETGADWPVTLASAALVGALRGRRRMSVDMRSPALDEFLAAREAIGWNDSAPSSTIVLPPQPKVRLASKAVGAMRRLRLVAGRTELGRWDLGAAVSSLEASPEQIARLTETLDPQTETALIELCDELEWDDCTMTVVDARQPLEETAAGTRWVVRGPVRIERRLVVGGFLEKIQSPETAPDARVRALALLQVQPPPGVDSQRYSN